MSAQRPLVTHKSVIFCLVSLPICFIYSIDSFSCSIYTQCCKWVKMKCPTVHVWVSACWCCRSMTFWLKANGGKKKSCLQLLWHSHVQMNSLRVIVPLGYREGGGRGWMCQLCPQMTWPSLEKQRFGTAYNTPPAANICGSVCDRALSWSSFFWHSLGNNKMSFLWKRDLRKPISVIKRRTL